jgi:hypothetical protein
LRQHEGHHTGACSDVQKALGIAQISPGAQQNSIGAYRMGRPILFNPKFFETERW